MKTSEHGNERWLDELRAEVEAHPGTNHLLLCRAATHPYTRSDYRQFGLQHHALVGFFTRYMEVLLLRAPSSREKLWLAKVLVDEYGEGSDGLDHVELYRHFLRAAGADDREMAEVELCPEVFAFVEEHLRVVRREPFLVGLGALGPGHEWAIPRMFSHLIPGLRRAGFAEEEISYFELHCEQDVQHASWMRESLAELAITEDQRALVRRGARASLEARYRLWTGIERRIVAARQPLGVEAVADGLLGTQVRHPVASPGSLAGLRALVERGTGL